MPQECVGPQPCPLLGLCHKAPHSLGDGIFVNAKHLEQLGWLPTPWHLGNSQAGDSDARFAYYGSGHGLPYATWVEESRQESDERGLGVSRG